MTQVVHVLSQRSDDRRCFWLITIAQRPPAAPPHPPPTLTQINTTIYDINSKEWKNQQLFSSLTLKPSDWQLCESIIDRIIWGSAGPNPLIHRCCQSELNILPRGTRSSSCCVFKLHSWIKRAPACGHINTTHTGEVASNVSPAAARCHTVRGTEAVGGVVTAGRAAAFGPFPFLVRTQDEKKENQLQLVFASGQILTFYIYWASVLAQNRKSHMQDLWRMQDTNLQRLTARHYFFRSFLLIISLNIIKHLQ